MSRVVAESLPAPRYGLQPAARPQGGTADTLSLAVALGFAALHVPLGILMHRVPALAEAHALGTLGIALLLAMGGRVERVTYGMAYIAGAEVLWRMTHAAPFWEYGKYATAAVVIFALLRLRPVRFPALPVSYFALLMPSAVVVFLDEGFAASRRHLSFNMSGPFTLMLCVWLFNSIRLTPARLRAVVVAFLAPVITMGTVILYRTLLERGIQFNTESNKATSGGFGPNQVATVLGLGALLAFVIGSDRKAPTVLRVPMLGIAIALAAQSALTFSRGGLVAATVAVAVLLLLSVADSKAARGLVVSMGLIVLVGVYVVLPRLDDFTGGTLSARFGDLDATGRDKIALNELQIFLDNPILGAGPQAYKRSTGGLAAHTELTRLPAQHGIFGLLALLALFLMALQRLKRSPDARTRGVAGALLTWSFLTMVHAAMRTVAPSFVFGLAFAQFRSDDGVPRENGDEPDGPPPLPEVEAAPDDAPSPADLTHLPAPQRRR